MVLRACLITTFLFNISAASFCFAEDSSSYPQSIISLSPTQTEELYLLGAEEKIVGVTTYCQKPPRAQKKEKIGTVTEVNLEKIVSLNPDIVLATSLTNPKTIRKLNNLGIKVVRFQQPKTFTEICKHFLALGRIVGKEEEAEEILSKAKKRVDLIKSKIKNLPKKKVFVQIGAKPLFTATKDDFINDFIKFAGGINIASNSKSGLYSREKVIKDNPDVIIITTMGIIGEEEKNIWMKYKTLNAAKNNRIYILDSYKVCSATPVSFVEVLDEIVKILHPQNE